MARCFDVCAYFVDVDECHVTLTRWQVKGWIKMAADVIGLLESFAVTDIVVTLPTRMDVVGTGLGCLTRQTTANVVWCC